MSDATQRCRAKSRNWSLKTCLRAKFPFDAIEPVPKGVAECAHRVGHR